MEDIIRCIFSDVRDEIAIIKRLSGSGDVGSAEIIAEAILAGSEAILAGSEAILAGSEAILAGSEAIYRKLEHIEMNLRPNER